MNSYKNESILNLLSIFADQYGQKFNTFLNFEGKFEDGLK